MHTHTHMYKETFVFEISQINRISENNKQFNESDNNQEGEKKAYRKMMESSRRLIGVGGRESNGACTNVRTQKE